ncbi:MAG TPA: hypothetical protein VIO38_00995 [Rariglobus sp.]
MSKKPAPKGLDAPGQALWRAVNGKYELRTDELVVLEKACRASDRIARMESVLGEDVTTLGSMGQTVVHPLIGEIRQHEAQVASLLRSLKLPDESGEVVDASARSTQARAAAQSRWGMAHGKGA